MTEHQPENAPIRVAGLQAPVEVFRDEWFIPHLRAQSVHDLFLVQGYVHAQDRMWQMDASRRQMQGRWAEWVGSGAVAADALARRLGAYRASERDYRTLGADAREMLDAYAAGVNAWIDERHDLPFEYGLLADAPEAWQPWDSIAVMRHRGYLMGSVWPKLMRAAALDVLDPADVAKLRYDDGGEERLCIPPGADSARWIADLATLRPAIEALTELRGDDAVDGGSNNWVVSGARTASGRPLLAGDPHRAFELPGMYAQMHISCPQFDAIGFTVPGVPAFPHFAHNGSVAWCVTHAFVDIHDLYVERFDRADPSRYEFRGQLDSAAVRTERIAVRDGADVEIDVVETRHGPVVAGDPVDGVALCLRSVQFDDTDLSFDALRRMLDAGSCDELFRATRGWGLIDHNVVAADTGGHVAHLVRALVPRRPVLNGWLPVPGWTGDYEWDGMIPWEEMPRVDDPERGYLATANNRVVSSRPDVGNYLSTDTHPPYRAARIEELLAGLPAARIGDMTAIHHDDVSVPAGQFRDAVLDLHLEDDASRRVQELLAGWDGRMSPDSRAAECYTRLRWHVARTVVARSGLEDLPAHRLVQAMPPGVSVVSQLWWTLPTLLRNDDTALLGGWTWAQVLADAVAKAAQQPAVPWSATHAATLSHPLASAFPDAARVLNPPGASLGGDNESVWANGCRAESGSRAVYGAVARYVYDVGNWDASRWVVLGGASGDPNSPHYVDQHAIWASCETVPMRYGWDGIAANAVLTLLVG